MRRLEFQSSKQRKNSERVYRRIKAVNYSAIKKWRAYLHNICICIYVHMYVYICICLRVYTTLRMESD